MIEPNRTFLRDDSNEDQIYRFFLRFTSERNCGKYIYGLLENIGREGSKSHVSCAYGWGWCDFGKVSCFIINGLKVIVFERHRVTATRVALAPFICGGVRNRTRSYRVKLVELLMINISPKSSVGDYSNALHKKTVATIWTVHLP